MNFQVTDPRPFGYVIGDTIGRRIEIEVARPFQLEAGKLPKAGRADAWLDLHKINLESSPGFRSTRYRLALTYQLINSPEAVENLALPKVSLRFAGAGKTAVQDVPEFIFSAAPITSPQEPAGQGLDELRPDRSPPLIPYAAHRSLFVLSLTVFILALLYIGYLRFGLPWRGPRPFAWAYRDLRRLAKQTGDQQAFREALLRLHRAFDQTAGRPLFPDQLKVFFIEHPRFAPLQGTTEKFFDLSRSEFFGMGAAERRVDRLLAFCREWRAVEAG